MMSVFEQSFNEGAKKVVLTFLEARKAMIYHDIKEVETELIQEKIKFFTRVTGVFGITDYYIHE